MTVLYRTVRRRPDRQAPDPTSRGSHCHRGWWIRLGASLLTLLLLVAGDARALEESPSDLLGAESEIGSPACGSVLAGADVAFSLVASTRARWLYVGSTPGANDLFDSGRLAASVISVAVSDLPTDGRILHVRVFLFEGGQWAHGDCMFTAATVPPPSLVTPACGSVLPGTAASLGWSDNGSPAVAWWLHAGRTQGANDLYDSGRLGAGERIHTVPGGLPGRGETVWIRLWYLPPGGSWRASDCSYTAATLPAPALAAPSCGATLTETRATFSWDDGGATPDSWWLYVGTSAGASDIHDSGRLAGSASSHDVTRLPDAGETLHVWLWYLYPGQTWAHSECTVTAATLPAPALESPVCGETLDGPSARFAWQDSGQVADAFWVYVGSGAGANDLYDSGRLGAEARSLDVSQLPVNGSPLHVELWFRTRGQWKSRRCIVTAATLAPPVIDAPVCGGQLDSNSPTFRWSANGREVDGWWLYVGSTPGANDWYDSGRLAPETREMRVRELPYDGESLYARLFHLERGRWGVSDCELTALLAPTRTVSGTYTGSGYESCSGTGIFANPICGRCTSQGTFNAAFRPVGAEEAPPPEVPVVQGPWIFSASGTSLCPDGYNNVFISVLPFQMQQRGTTFLGRTFEAGDPTTFLPSGCTLSCAAPGDCSFSCPPSDLSCSLSCSPATWNCALVYDIFGQVTSTSITGAVRYGQTFTIDCGSLGRIQVSGSASNDLRGTVR